MGVMGDFSGDPTAPLQPMADRKFVQIDRDNFNDVMARMNPGLKLRVDNKLSEEGGQMAVDLKFNAIEDFEPARVAQQVPALRALMETRAKLRDLMSKVDRSEELEGLLEKVLQNENELKTLSGQLGIEQEGGLIMSGAQTATQAAGTEVAEGVSILDQVVAATKQTAPDHAQDLMKNLVEQAMSGTVTFDKNLTRTFDRAIAAIDHKLSEQLNAIMHDPKFLKLEGTWRGLHYLVMNSETSTTLKIRVLERVEARPVARPAARGGIRPEPAVQEDLRERVRHAGRRALCRADRRLRMDAASGRHRDAAADLQRRGGGVRAVHLGRRPRHVRLRQLYRTGQAARPGEDLRDQRLHEVAQLPRQRGCPLRHAGDAAHAGPAAVRRSDQADRRVRLRGSPVRRGRRRQGRWTTTNTAG